MKIASKHRRHAQRGAALVIAIFTLMLISVVATAMILMADSETAMKGNYKSAMQAFYDAKAGLEEGRGRLWTNNPNSIANCVFPAPGAMMPTAPAPRVCYIINPSPGQVVNPLDSTQGNPYADFEFQQEWGIPVTGASVQPFVNSTSPVPGTGIAGPLYKWVRITPRSEASSNLNVDGDGDFATNTNPLFYNGMQQLVSTGAPVPNAVQVLTVTALAVTPYGSRRMVQYSVAPSAFAAAMATFPSALTLDGNGVSFTGPSGGSGSGSFQINGNDASAPPGPPAGVPAIGYTNSSDESDITAAAVPANNYVSPSGVPSVGLVTLPPLLQTPSGLDSLVQNITRNADLVLNPTPGTAADQSSLTAMSATNPMVVVVNGDFHLTHAGGSSSFTGYGLLVVTGTLRYDPDDSWNGVILVIGTGVFDGGSQHGRGGQINGSVFVANTRDNAGNLLSSLGPASYNQTGGGSGIQYGSSWLNTTQAMIPYQVLSFREITQTTP